MYFRQLHLTNTFLPEYQDSWVPGYPSFGSKSALHPYFNNSFSPNEPFPVPVPLYPSLAALKGECAQYRNVQPLFICSGLRAACQIFYKLQAVHTKFTIEYTKKIDPAVEYATKDQSTEITMRNYFKRGGQPGGSTYEDEETARQERDSWMFDDPFSIKLNPFWIAKNEMQETIGSLPAGTIICSRTYTQGDYLSDNTFGGGGVRGENLGELRILGVAKIATGEYAILGRSDLTPWWPAGGEGDYVGRSPGTCYLGLAPYTVNYYTSEQHVITLPGGISATLFCHNTTEQRWSAAQKKYIEVHAKYTKADLSLSFASGAYSRYF